MVKEKQSLTNSIATSGADGSSVSAASAFISSGSGLTNNTPQNTNGQL
jgi:hypothetical protein